MTDSRSTQGLTALSQRQKKSAQSALVQIIALICGLIIIIPVLYCLSLSFMRVSEILSRPPQILPNGLYMGNYATAWTKSRIPRFLLNSMIISLVCSVVRIIIASLAGYGFAFLKFRGRSLLFYLVLGTMLIPGDVILTSNYFTISQLNLVNTYLGIMILYFVSANNIFMMRQHFLTISGTLREAAQIDGCTNFRFYLQILLPISSPVLVTVFISSFISTWNMYLFSRRAGTPEKVAHDTTGAMHRCGICSPIRIRTCTFTVLQGIILLLFSCVDCIALWCFRK